MPLFADDIYYGSVKPTAIIPKQAINLQPTSIILGVQTQQLRVTDSLPDPPSAKINVQRRLLPNGKFRFAVQFLQDPAQPNYSGTSAFVITDNGTTALQASGGQGPIVFDSSVNTGAASVSLQTNTTTGPSSSIDFGDGSSNKLNRT